MDKKDRTKKMIKTYIIVLVLGILYAIFFHFTGWGIPCVIRMVTRHRCPGCGLTHFVVNCLTLNFKEAITWNYMAPLICIYLVWFIIEESVQYVNNDNSGTSRPLTVFSVIMCVLAIIWWVVRNIIGV